MYDIGRLLPGPLKRKSPRAQPSTSTASASLGAAPGERDWPTYNKTLTSNRFSPLTQINKTNADKLKVLCTYDTGQYTGFTSDYSR
jgi:alcohol dehydrogenase (cytochrome c)